MEAKINHSCSFEPSKGVLIPSPVISHTHAVAPHPFDPNALLTVKDGLMYLPEHAIVKFPFEQQAIRYAGQSVVVREMAKVQSCEAEVRRVQDLPEIQLSIHKNFKVKPVENSRYWRVLLGWSGSTASTVQKQLHRYVTFVPGKSKLLKGIKDKYVWDHQSGEWKHTTMSGVQEATKRRIWVCEELERIDALRYDTEAEWTRNVKESYMRGLNKKPKRGEDGRAADSQSQDVEDVPPQWSKTLSLDKGVMPTIEPASKKLRLSIEPPIDLPPPEIPDYQTTKSSFSEVLSISVDGEHEVYSQAPEPESPIKRDVSTKETNADFLKRYSFVLDIPATDGQRVDWINFLEKYRWNKSLISSLRIFFMADTSPTASQTAAFLKKLKEVCSAIEEVNGRGPHKKYRLLWNAKVIIQVKEAAAEARVETEPSPPPHQPTWLSPPRRRSTAPPPEKETTAPKTPTPSPMTASPTSSQLREAALAEDIQSAMKKHVRTLKKGTRVEPPCDRCRQLGLKCLINSTSCQRCAAAHDKCSWNEVAVEEVRDLGILQRGEGTPTPARPKRGKGKRKGKGANQAGGRPGKRKAKSQGTGRSAKKRRSLYDFPVDGDETRAFFDDADGEIAGGDGDETKAFLNGAGKDSGGDEEYEWVPSS